VDDAAGVQAVQHTQQWDDDLQEGKDTVQHADMLRCCRLQNPKAIGLPSRAAEKALSCALGWALAGLRGPCRL
jgi:hypothetical protein